MPSSCFLENFSGFQFKESITLLFYQNVLTIQPYSHIISAKVWKLSELPHIHSDYYENGTISAFFILCSLWFVKPTSLLFYWDLSIRSFKKKRTRYDANWWSTLVKLNKASSVVNSEALDSFENRYSSRIGVNVNVHTTRVYFCLSYSLSLSKASSKNSLNHPYEWFVISCLEDFLI